MDRDIINRIAYISNEIKGLNVNLSNLKLVKKALSNGFDNGYCKMDYSQYTASTTPMHHFIFDMPNKVIPKYIELLIKDYESEVLTKEIELKSLCKGME